jgi:small GTP-binding protein
MDKDKKIIICGPPNSGKTTIVNVFFKKANPLKLLKNSLEPTRGINSEQFSLFVSNLGIFDLAGQENKDWLKKDKDIFEHSDIILCVFDINNSLKSIVSFLIKILKIKKDFHTLSECKIITFLHKVDLANRSYISQKHRAVSKFFESRYPHIELDFYLTSITRQYFYNTFNIILEILNLLFQKDLIPISQRQFEFLKTELYLILKIDSSVKYSIETLSEKIRLNKNLLNTHLKRLEKLGFLTFLNNRDVVCFTERCGFFKQGFLKEVHKIEEISRNKETKLFYTLGELNNIPID